MPNTMPNSALKQALGYRRFTGPPRILILDSGYFMIPDLFAAAAALGHAVAGVPTPTRDGADYGPFVGGLLRTLCHHRPDFVLTMNHLGLDADGKLAGLLARYEIPLASWFVDHPAPILGGAADNATPQCQVFCLERTALPWLRAHGFEDPAHLPTAAGHAPDGQTPAPAVARSEAERRLSTSLCFIGDSWYRKGFVDPPPHIVAAAERLRARATSAASLLALTEADPSGGRGRYQVLGAALAQEACAARVGLARALQPLGLRVHGDARWAELVPGLDLHPPLEALRDAPAAFASAAVNVNRTAPQLLTGLNQRVWDVPAAGGFLLTDAQDELAEHFRADEIATYIDEADLVEQARFFLARPEHRAQISARARARVLAEHCCTHRLQHIVQVMRARFLR